MDDRDWQILHILYQKKNITKTAQLMFITQPALTKRAGQIIAAIREIKEEISNMKQ